MSKKLFLLLGIFLLFSVMFFKPVLSYTPPPNGTRTSIFTWSTHVVNGCRVGVNSSVIIACYPHSTCACTSNGEPCYPSGFYSGLYFPFYCYGTDDQYHYATVAGWGALIPNDYNVTITPWIVCIGVGCDVPNPNYDPTWVRFNWKIYNSSSMSECQASDSTHTCINCMSFGYLYCSHSYQYTVLPADTVQTLTGSRSDWIDACSSICSTTYTEEGGLVELHTYVNDHVTTPPSNYTIPPLTPSFNPNGDIVDILQEVLVGVKSFFAWSASPIFLFLFVFCIVFVILMIFGLVVAVAKRASKSI